MMALSSTTKLFSLLLVQMILLEISRCQIPAEVYPIYDITQVSEYLHCNINESCTCLRIIGFQRIRTPSTRKWGDCRRTAWTWGNSDEE